VDIKGLNCHYGCRNRRCLDPLLPSNVSTPVKCSPADESSPCSQHLRSVVVSDLNNGSCKDVSFDSSVSSVVENTAKSSPGRIISDVSANSSTEPSTPSTYRHRSQKFSDSTTWSRFRQQRATALKSRSEKVFVASVCWTYAFIVCCYLLTGKLLVCYKRYLCVNRNDFLAK